MLIRNLRPFEVEIPDVGLVEAGGTVDVPDEVANGVPATETSPGVSGLLAQADAWAAVKKNDKSAVAGEEV